MELVKIEHDTITVNLDPLDCLRLAQACRAADDVLAGNRPEMPVFGLPPGSTGSAHTRPLGQLYATLGALFAACAVAGDDAYDLPIRVSVESRWPGVAAKHGAPPGTSAQDRQATDAEPAA